VTFGECRGGAEVTSCTISGGGHVWPGNAEYSADARKTRPDGYICSEWKNTVGRLNPDFDAKSAVWEFFKKYSLE